MNAARRFADWCAGKRYSGAFPGSAFPRGRLYQGSAARAFVAHSQAAPGRTPDAVRLATAVAAGDLPQSARHGEDQVAASDLIAFGVQVNGSSGGLGGVKGKRSGKIREASYGKRKLTPTGILLT